MSDHTVHIPVRECMTPFVLTVEPYDTLAHAWELMRSNEIRRLPVVEYDELVGIVTERDILNARPADPARRMALKEIAGSLEQLTVTTVMSHKPVTVFESDTVGRVAELMLEHKIGGLPVVASNGRLQGLITESNLFRLIARRWREDNLIFSGAHD